MDRRRRRSPSRSFPRACRSASRSRARLRAIPSSSAAASSAYLTISEIFPLELRALSIALFYAAGTALGGAAAPWLFGILIGSGSRDAVSNGYALGAVLMLAAAGIEAWLGVDAERKSLERIAAPLSTHVG